MEKNIVNLLEKGQVEKYTSGGIDSYYNFNLKCEHMFFAMNV